MNIRKGLIRLWLICSSIWAAYFGIHAYLAHTEWQQSFALGKELSSKLNDERIQLAQLYVSREKSKRTELAANGWPLLPLNEEVLQRQASEQAIREINSSISKEQEDRLYRLAFDARNERDQHLKNLPIVPAFFAVLFIAIPWVINGFKSKKSGA
jgi:hypothetical protein